MIYDDVPISPERVRQAVTRAVLATSLRQVARDVGMSPSGLDKYLTGISEPYSQTRRKLEQWYVRNAAAHDGISDATAAAALTLLLDGIAPDLVARTRHQITEVIVAAHRDGGSAPPAWAAGPGMSARD
jgi:transcriptional regulator with XRE-family HTH domain